MRILIILGTIFFSSQALSCPVDSSNFPEFTASIISSPQFDGESCSLSDWRDHHRILNEHALLINKYDDDRLNHDILVRRYDRKLQIGFANGSCSVREYDNASALIREANLVNDGTRKDSWWTMRRALTASLNVSSSNIAVLLLDQNLRCDSN